MANEFDRSDVSLKFRVRAEDLADEVSVFAITLNENMPGMSENSIALIVSAVYEGKGRTSGHE